MKKVVVLDTNFLSSAYEKSSEYFQQLYNIMEDQQEYIYYSETVLKEFEQFDKVDKITKSLIYGFSESLKQLNTDYNAFKRFNRYGTTDIHEEYTNVRILLGKLNSKIKTIRNSKKLEFLNVENDFSIRELIEHSKSNGMILPKLSSQEILSISRLADVRVKNNIPPGFKDVSKKGINKYNDLFIWMEILSFGKDLKEPCELIFVTDDNKENIVDKNNKVHPFMAQEFEENFPLGSTLSILKNKEYINKVKSQQPNLEIDSIIISNLIFDLEMKIEKEIKSYYDFERYEMFVEQLNYNVVDVVYELAFDDKDEGFTYIDVSFEFRYGYIETPYGSVYNADEHYYNFKLNREKLLYRDFNKVVLNREYYLITENTTNLKYNFNSIDKLDPNSVPNEYLELLNKGGFSPQVINYLLRLENVELSVMEEKILEMRFGINNNRKHTLDEVGAAVGKSRSEIRSIEASALRKLIQKSSRN